MDISLPVSLNRQARLAVEKKLQESLDGGGPVPVNAQTWRETEKRVMKRLLTAPKRRPTHGKNR